MKKIFPALAFAAACLAISCNDSKETKSSSSSDAETIKKNNMEIYRAIETGDGTKLKDYLAADAIDHNGGPNGEDVVGSDSIIKMLTTVKTCFEPGFKFSPVAQAVDGEYLFALVDMVGTTTANPGMGMPPSTKMNMRSVDVIRIVDGKAKEHWGYMSMADMMKMMESMPGAGGAAMQPTIVDTVTRQEGK